MKHLLIRNPGLSGYQYGVLRAFEDAIIRITRAEVLDLPPVESAILKKAGHGMRLDFLRNSVTKKRIVVKADVLWCILMGPETFALDLFSGWKHVKHRIVYLLDTYPSHFNLIGQLFSENYFSIHITAFNEAKDHLEKVTGKKWSVVQHAASLNFLSVPVEERVIGFSSYGRRMDGFHKILLDFCQQHNIYYDYTNHDGRHPIADPVELYKQYIWHVNHSVFNIAWPVEFANPKLAGGLHPVTCRWFEASCAGAILMGKKPANEKFDEYLFGNEVVEIDPQGKKTEIYKVLERAWSEREHYLEKAGNLQKNFSEQMIWDNRVEKILNLILE